MRIAMLGPIAWRTPPRHYGPWEMVTSVLTEELIERGVDVTLFATGDSVTKGELRYVCRRGYEEDSGIDPKVWECLHISECFESAHEFDIIHNQFDFLPLSYSRLTDTPVVTTIHGFSSEKILPVYEKYNDSCYYVSISKSDRSKRLSYAANVYHGIDLESFRFNRTPKDDYLLYYGRIHPDKGTREAIEIAGISEKRLVIAGIIQDREYYNRFVLPCIRRGEVDFIGSVGEDERSDLLGNAVALLHPINFNEPFGLSVVESMACGTPVIAFNRGSMQELIKDGETGFLVSGTKEAAERAGTIQSIDRKRCRLEVENRFTKQRMGQEYIEVYRDIIDRSKGGRLCQ